MIKYPLSHRIERITDPVLPEEVEKLVHVYDEIIKLTDFCVGNDLNINLELFDKIQDCVIFELKDLGYRIRSSSGKKKRWKRDIT